MKYYLYTVTFSKSDKVAVEEFIQDYSLYVEYKNINLSTQRYIVDIKFFKWTYVHKL